MAAYSNSGTNSNIRVRLYFDYPPPAVVDSRMCWLLVDLSACRVVADLESIIKERFEFSRGSILNLFIEDCYLPHTESIYVVRDNDSVRVKVHCVTQVNGHDSSPDALGTNCRKRQRPTEEGESSAETKKKKRGKSKILEEGAEGVSDDGRKSQGQHAEEKRSKKKKKSKKTERVADSPKPAASTKTVPASVENPVKSTATKAKNKPITSASPKARTKDVSEIQRAPAVLQSTNHLPRSAAAKRGQPSSSDSEEEMEVANQAQSGQPGPGLATLWSGTGYSEGRTGHGGPEDQGRGRGGGVDTRRSESLFESSTDGAKVSSYQTDSLTNTSFILQNGAESVPTQDYSSMPLLAAPPQVGQKIAFKLLELTENYTPEVSEYKEGKIVSFDPTTKQIELELLHVSKAPTEPGKFDLVYQNPDGTERVEYAVSRGAWVTERWDSLLEPRLIL